MKDHIAEMSLPRALSTALTRFESSKEVFRIVPVNKTTFADTEQIVFKLPTSGVIDLHTLSLVGGLKFVGGASAAAGNMKFQLGQLIRRLEVYSGGASIWGASCSDFGQAYMMRRTLAEPSYKASTSNALYKNISTTGPAANSTKTIYAMLNDHPICFKNCRFLPLAAFPELEIRITIDVANRMTLPTGTTFGEITPYLLCTRINIPGPANVEALVASKLSTGPLELAMEQWSTYIGVLFTGSASVPVSIATQSLDYLIYGFKTAGQTGDSYHESKYAGPDATYKLEVSSTPVSSWDLTSVDAWWQLAEALDMNQNNLFVDPQVSSLNDWTNKKFMFLQRFTFPTVSDENRSMISGMNTYGAQLPLTLQVRGGDGTTYNPFAIAIHTSTVELAPGRQVSVVN